MLRLLKFFWEDERGQGLTEYGLLLVIVSIVALGILIFMADQVDVLFGKAKDALFSTATE